MKYDQKVRQTDANNRENQLYTDLYADWQEFEPYVPKEITFEQFCIDWNKSLAELHNKEEETPMGSGRYMRDLLPAEKRREQTRKANERRLKRFRPAIHDGDGKLLVDKGICRKKYDKAKDVVDKAIKAYKKKKSRPSEDDPNFYYFFVRKMKEDSPKLPESIEIVRKYEKGVKLAERYGAYDKSGTLILPTDAKPKKEPGTEKESEPKDPRHAPELPAPVGREPHSKSPKPRFVTASESIAQEKKGLKCGSFKKASKDKPATSFRLIRTSLPSDPGKRPYPYF